MRIGILLPALIAALFATFAAESRAGGTDFSRAVAAQASGAKTVTYVIAPGRAFDLVGFRWRGSGTPRIEVQSEGPRGWSEWVEPQVAGIDGPDRESAVDRHARKSSEPVWTGYSRRIRVRVSGRRFSGLRAQFMRIKTDPTSAGVAATGGVEPGTVQPGGGKKANADPPPIITRAQWDPRNRCKPRTKPGFGEVIGTVVHHTESTNSYSQGQAASVVLGICRYHRYTRGWDDVGYNLLIDRFGRVYEGRAGGVDKPVIGAHAQGYNGQTAGISLVGGFMSTAPPQAALNALKTTLRWKLSLAGVSRAERVPMISTGGGSNRFKYGRLVFVRPVAGHRDLDFTDCPGNNLYARLDGLQDFLTGSRRTVTRLSARLKRVAQGNGQAVLASGRLTAGGVPSSGRTVALEVYNAKGWQQIAETTTDPSGIWRITVAPKGRYYMRGRYSGNDQLRAVRSRWYYSPRIRRATAG